MCSLIIKIQFPHTIMALPNQESHESNGPQPLLNPIIQSFRKSKTKKMDTAIIGMERQYETKQVKQHQRLRH